jgi:hypothetical protein
VYAGPPGPLTEDDLARIRERFTAAQTEPGPAAVLAGPVAYARATTLNEARILAGFTVPPMMTSAATAPWAAAAAAEAPSPARAELAGLITAISSLQNHLQTAELDRAARHRAAQRFAWEDELRAPAGGRVHGWPSRLLAAIARALAAVIAWRPPPGRTAGLYDHGVMAAPADHARRYAAARARYIATGDRADLAEMERHVGATPGDGGPAWAPPGA